MRGRNAQKLPRTRLVFFKMPIRKQASSARHGSESLAERCPIDEMGTAVQKEEVGYGGTWQRKMGGGPASQAPESRPGGFSGLDPLSTSIPSPPPGTLLTTLHFRMTLGVPECVCVCVCVCACVGGRVCGCTCFSFINMSQKSSHRCEEGGWPSATRYSKTPPRVEGAFRSSRSH